MKNHTLPTDDAELLAECYGSIFTLFWADVNRPSMHLAGWQQSYFTDGLAFGKTRQTAERLRRLVAAGYLDASGSTQGRSFKLTTKGTFTGAALYGIPPAELREWLAYISTTMKQSEAMLPGTDTKIIMGFELIESAGGWWQAAQKTDKAWRRYILELNKVDNYLVPLMAMGWLVRYADVNGRFWAVAITNQGAAALANWPLLDALPEPDSGESFRRGFNTGLALLDRTPPFQYANTIARNLPASKWW